MRVSFNIRLVILGFCFFVLAAIPMEAKQEENTTGFLRVYQVDKRVSDFPETDDFTTPEAAYAVVNRVLASGEQSKWRQISVMSIANRLPSADTENQTIDPENAKVWLNARILEVRIFRNTNAVVLAELSRNPNNPKIDNRFLEFEDGRWLNKGQDGASDSLEEARAQTNARFAYLLKNPSRPAIDNPEAYLKPFVEFLKINAREPEEFVKNALSTYKVTIIGEVHHRPRYWAFNSSLVTETAFSSDIGTIYLELPSNDQNLVDKFLADDNCDTMPIIEMLRDNLWMGWPDQAMLDFFIKVWMVNHNLEPQNRIRIVLVDMQRPWSKMETRQDLIKYNVNRDKFMAENIISDIQEHPREKRNTLFIVGVGHTALNFEYFKDAPVMTGGWYLRKELGKENVYAIMQHRCVETNMGQVSGRLCLGLFDSAFASLGNNPMAFSLDTGPFGRESYDADPDRPVSSTFKDGFNAYLYLGPLETEIFSPLIAGFYTDEFVQELERRFQITYDQKWSETYRVENADAESFIKWMGNSWGKPRKDWQENILGPLDAWNRGGQNWRDAVQQEKLEQATENPDEVVEAAKKIFETIQKADYDFFLNPDNKQAWQKFGISYTVYTDYPSFVKWMCTTFKTNPIVSIELGKSFTDSQGRPTIPYKLTLKDGKILKGDLPFEYDAMNNNWYGIHGIDWHLHDPFKESENQ